MLPIVEAFVRAGLGKRLMWDSGQMRWPDKIGEGIEAVEQAPFLTDEQERDILYNTPFGSCGSTRMESRRLVSLVRIQIDLRIDKCTGQPVVTVRRQRRVRSYA